MPEVPARFDVLVIDDESVVSDAIQLVLGEEGLTVAAVPDGRMALVHPAALTCRLVLCDLMLPDRPGFEVIRLLRQMRPDVSVIVITGYPTSENAMRAVEAGAADFLPKPFTESELLEVVRRVLGHAGRTAGRREK